MEDMEKQGVSITAERGVNRYSDEETLVNNSDQLTDIENASSIGTKEILDDIYEKLNFLITKVKQIDDKQGTVDQRLSRVERLTKRHDKKVGSLKKQQSKISGDMSIFNKDLQKLHVEQTEIRRVMSDLNQDFNPDKTLVVTNPPLPIGNMYDWAKALICTLGGYDNMIVNVTRTSRCGFRKGVLKIQVRSVTEKIQLLHQKSKLRYTREFKNIYVRSSKSYLERVCDLNFRTVLDELQHGRQYRIATNGRIVKSNEELPVNGQGGKQKSDIPIIPSSSVGHPEVKRDVGTAVQAVLPSQVVRPKSQSQSQVHSLTVHSCTLFLLNIVTVIPNNHITDII